MKNIKENIKAYYIGSDIDKVLDYIQQKDNIIKEVREYIETEKVIKEGNTLEQITNYERKLLQILEKEN